MPLLRLSIHDCDSVLGQRLKEAAKSVTVLMSVSYLWLKDEVCMRVYIVMSVAGRRPPAVSQKPFFPCCHFLCPRFPVEMNLTKQIDK